MKYFLCCASSAKELEQQINEKIKEGYVLHGTINVAMVHKAAVYDKIYYRYDQLPDIIPQFYQALIKE